MGYIVHRNNIRRNFYTKLWSCGFFVSICLATLSFVLPFVAAWTSEHFWVKHSTYREQPTVTFKKKFMILLGATDSSSNDEAITLSWCTNEYGNEIMSSTTRIPMIQIMEIDNDDDGTIDSARLEVRVPIKSNERVHKVWALALFAYKLKDFVQVEWEAAAVVDEQSSLPGRGLVVDGEFSLHQRDLFSAFQKNSASALYADQTMLEAGMDASVEDFLPENLLRNYTARDFMSVYEYRYPVWLPRTSELPVDQSFSYFDLNITVRFPTDTIQYRPNFGETLKHGLMQYIPFYIVIAPLIAFVKHFLFEHQVIETEVVSEMPYGSQKLHRF